MWNIKVTADEESLAIDGVVYIANHDCDPESCEGCAFIDAPAMHCSNIPCSPDKREDGTTSVIFIKQE